MKQPTRDYCNAYAVSLKIDLFLSKFYLGLGVEELLLGALEGRASRHLSLIVDLAGDKSVFVNRMAEEIRMRSLKSEHYGSQKIFFLPVSSFLRYGISFYSYPFSEVVLAELGHIGAC